MPSPLLLPRGKLRWGERGVTNESIVTKRSVNLNTYWVSTEVCRLVGTNLRQEFAHAWNFQFKIPTKSVPMRRFSLQICANQPANLSTEASSPSSLHTPSPHILLHTYTSLAALKAISGSAVPCGQEKKRYQSSAFQNPKAL